MFLAGLVGLVRSHMILHDSGAILNILVKWDHKIVRSYDPDRDFDNYANDFLFFNI